MPVEQVTAGAWTARWGDWLVRLNVDDTSDVTVWRWAQGGGITERMQLGWRGGFATPVDAVTWACDVLREDGATVMVLDRPSMTLEQLLQFSPAPRACA